MRIMITAGGTSEAIDGVRKITNSSTGLLGSHIFRQVEEAGRNANMDVTVHYLHGEKAVLPEYSFRPGFQAYFHRITDTASLKRTIEDILSAYRVDAVVHSMAVSDFYVARAMTVKEELAEIMALMASRQKPKPSRGKDGTAGGIHIDVSESLDLQKDPDRDQENKWIVEVDQGLEEALERLLSREQAEGRKKLSSAEPLILGLAKTPKIIEIIRKLAPEARLIGFKLQDHVEEDRLIQVASRLGQQYKCDFVVANDMKDVSADRHRAMFVKDGRVLDRFETKSAIARGIAERLMADR